MDRFRNSVLSLAISRVGLAHHLENRYTLTAVGALAYSGKMNSIVKNYKDYRMDVICRNPHGCRDFGWLAREKGSLGRRAGRSGLFVGQGYSMVFVI